MTLTMTTVAAGLIGYVIGTLPTAQTLGMVWGVDLRRDGSGNPGANNARRLGGFGLAGLVLLTEAAKGVGAVLVGHAIGGDVEAVAAGLGAVAGNVFNIWYRFQGGKGLGISIGVIATIWPPALAICLAVIVIAVLVTRSSGLSTLTAIAALNVIGVSWGFFDWPNAWGIAQADLLILFALGVTLVIWRRHWIDWVVKRHGRQSIQEPV